MEYIADSAVDAVLDQQLRDTLATCFIKSGDEVFRQHRYWREMPQHRWFIRDGDRVIAHVAVHDKVVVFGGQEHRIAGIAEVCVLPEHRGKGHVKALLATAHAWLRPRGYEYAVLFGQTQVYSSSGYVNVVNLVNAGKSTRDVMVLPLGKQPWPATDVILPGQIF